MYLRILFFLVFLTLLFGCTDDDTPVTPVEQPQDTIVIIDLPDFVYAVEGTEQNIPFLVSVRSKM